MITNPNQKVITINREMPKQTKENKRPYMIAYVDNMREAMQNLNKVSSLKLYMYLLGNNNYYKFALSTKEVSEECGISINSAQDAVRDLIEKGYLVLTTNNHYEFFEAPRREIINKFGKSVLLSYEELLLQCKGDEDKAMEYWRNAK